MPPSRAWVLGRRRRWLKGRRNRGLKRPAPLAGLVVNTASVSVGTERAKQILRNAADAHVNGLRVDYLLGSEGDDFYAADVLGPRWSVHHDQSHPDKDGAFQALRKSRGYLDDKHSVKASDALPDILPARWLSVAQVHVDPKSEHRWWFRSGAGHAPPMRAWKRWPAYMVAVRREKFDVFGADNNKLARAVTVALGRRVSAVHILGLSTRWWLPVSKSVAVDVGGDHKAVGFVLWPEKEKA